jgi:hypothetical protein
MADKSEQLKDLEVERGANAEEPVLEPEGPQTPWERIKIAFKHARRTSQSAKSPSRREMGKDRTKSLVLLVGAAFGMVLMFLGVFSSPQKPQNAQSRRVSPDLGRRTTPGQPATGAQTGSVTPVMDATGASGNEGEAGGDQLTAADIGRTGRPIQPGSTVPTTGKNPHALGTIDFSDPALQRQYAMHGYVPAAPPPPPAVPPVVATSENNELNKHSLVFVRAEERGQSHAVEAQPAIERESSMADALPTGTRLVARLESPVSSAVAAPAVAVIEYNYERDGEIVVPAGARAVGKLQQANRSGYVSLHFDAIQMPDGSTGKIDAGAMGLDYKPLKGDVTGRKRATRFLVESLTGLGTMATYLVGNNSSSFNAPFSSSALLRERLAGNVGIAGQNELNELTLNQNIVVTLPGNTRFYLVLQKGTTPGATLEATRPGPAASTTSNSNVPSLQELRQLLELKREMSQMYEQAGASAGGSPQP